MSITSEIQRLYAVTMEVTAVVLATSERDAEAVFKYAQGDILSDGGADIFVDCEIKSIADLPPNWDEDCQPYGAKASRTIVEWLDLAPPEIVRDTKTIDMFAELQP